MHSYAVSLSTVAKEKWEPLLQLETVIDSKAREMKWLVDTGAQVAIMGLQDVKRFRAVKLKPSRIRLAMADETRADVMGQVSVTVRTAERTHELQVHVVKRFVKPTLNFLEVSLPWVSLRKDGPVHNKAPRTKVKSPTSPTKDSRGTRRWRRQSGSTLLARCEWSTGQRRRQIRCYGSTSTPHGRSGALSGWKELRTTKPARSRSSESSSRRRSATGARRTTI